MEYAIKEIIKIASPETQIFISDLFLRFGNNISISKYTYIGWAANAPFYTFRSRQIYAALQCDLSIHDSNPAATINTLIFDELNTFVFQFRNDYRINVGVDVNTFNNFSFKNFYFGRLESNPPFLDMQVHFIGFKIGI